jgi:hypothetical protein
MKLDTPLDPVDVTAARVISGGTRHNMIGVYPRLHWEQCPPLIPRAEWPPLMVDLSARKFGRLTVIGFAQHKAGGNTGGRWAVRCACGDYEIRSAKAIKNPNNADDKCHICRKADLTARFRANLASGKRK